MSKKVTKAIICAAGLGTRFLPMTKAMPKEMLPIIDKPIIQYVVEEAVAAGITDIIIVGSANKRTIEDHFDHQYELEAKLRNDGKAELAESMEKVAELANFIYLRQKGTYGNATPVLNAAHLLDNEAVFGALRRRLLQRQGSPFGPTRGSLQSLPEADYFARASRSVSSQELWYRRH